MQIPQWEASVTKKQRRPRRKEEEPRKPYRKHEHYFVSQSISPAENVLEIIKKALPGELAIEKLKDSKAFQDNFSRGRIVIRSVQIYPIKKSRIYGRYVDNSELGLEKIAIEIRAPGDPYIYGRRRRGSDKKWSVPVLKNGKISITVVQDIYKELRSILEVEEKKQEDHKIAERVDQENLERVRSYLNQVVFSRVQRASIYQRRKTEQDGKVEYTYDLTLSNISEEEVKHLSLYVQKVLGVNFTGANK